MNSFQEKNFEGLDTDLRLYYCGRRIGSIGHSFGPYDRDSYLIYYIKEGEAELSVGGRRLLLRGEGFFVNFPRSGCVYRTQDSVPWSIKWIAAEGEQIGRYLSLLGVTPESPYLPISRGREAEAVLDEMYEHFDRPSLASRILCVSLVHKLFAVLAAGERREDGGNPYVRRALAMIGEGYADPALSVRSLAAALGLHPNYFSILFKRETGQLPKAAIQGARMRAAAKMLRFTDRPVGEIAREVGFLDELYFSRAFRREYGLAPSAFRRSLSYPI